MRLFAAVLAGYLAMAIFVMVGLTLAWQITGAERALKPNSMDVSTLWIALDYGVGFAAAVFGGWLAVMVGKRRQASLWLAALVVVLGLTVAFLKGDSEGPTEVPARVPDIDDLTFIEAGNQAQHPPWYFYTIPLVGCLGVLMGGRVRTTAEP